MFEAPAPPAAFAAAEPSPVKNVPCRRLIRSPGSLVSSDQASFLLFGSFSSSISSLTRELASSQRTDLEQLLLEALAR